MGIIRVLLVFSTVVVTLLTAMLLNYGAKNCHFLSYAGISIIFIVVIINLIKFKTWGIIYNRFHLNESYPLTALFFPLIYIVAISNGEAIFEWKKMIGVLLILAGTIIISKQVKIV